MVIAATSPVHFHFSRDGGAIIAARISVWSGVAGANPQRVAVVNFEHPLDQSEDSSVVLAPGSYVCVFKCFVRNDLNGVYRFNVAVDDQPVFLLDQTGDVGTLPEQSALLESQFDITVA